MPETGVSDLVIIYFVGSVAMLLLAGGIIFFFITYQKRILSKELELNKVKAEQQEEIIKNTILAQEKERKRIARDLHDEVGAMLSVVKLNVSRIEKKVEVEKTKQLTRQTKSYLDDTIKQVRRISRALLPPSLEKLGLSFAIEELANWVNNSEELKINLYVSGKHYRFDPKEELSMFRIVQELLNNSIKHANASEITINTRFSAKGVAILFADNGVGFDIKKLQQTGLGLKNLESRSEIIGAKFKMKSVPGKGTSAILCIMKEVKNG